MFELPSSNDAKVSVLDYLAGQAEVESRPRRVQWLINYYWMQGVRTIEVDYRTGQVTAVYKKQNPRDMTYVRYEDIVARYQTEMGRLLRMDTRPSASRRGFGFDAIRRASGARVLLDYLTSAIDHDRLKFDVVNHLLTFGLCGLGSWVRNVDQPGISAEGNEGLASTTGLYRAGDSKLVLELIPCWELSPVPAKPAGASDLTAIRRHRWVPLSWLKGRSELKVPDDDELLQVREAPYGVRPDSGAFLEASDPTSTAGTAVSATTGEYGKEIQTKYALLEEFFGLHDEKDRLCSWTAKAGKAILAHYDYKDRSVYLPLGLPRYYPLGGFYGRSFVEILQPINAEQEQMASRLFQIVKDLDAFGTNLVPGTWGISKAELTEHKVRNKVIYYDPDPAVPDAKVQGIAPVTLNDFPGKVLAVAGQMMDRLTQQSPMLSGEAVGRVDSMAGLSFLHETGSIPLSVPANSIADGYAQVYKSILSVAPDLVGSHTSLPLVGLDDNILGLEVDGPSGTVNLKPSNFPMPWEVEVGVKDKLPAPSSVREQKLMAMLDKTIITPTEFRFHVWRENLDLPVGNWGEQENFRKATLQVLTLFGDGVQPGPTMANFAADNPQVHLLVIQAFMAKPEFQFASKEVRAAFEDMKQKYQLAIGSFPESMPRPEDAAIMTQAMQGQMGGPMGASGPMAGPF